MPAVFIVNCVSVDFCSFFVYICYFKAYSVPNFLVTFAIEKDVNLHLKNEVHEKTDVSFDTFYSKLPFNFTDP